MLHHVKRAYRTVSSMIDQYYHEREFQKQAKEPRYDQITGWITKWRMHEYNRWAMDDIDLLKLYDYILSRKPKLLVEFGTATGYSTAVIGYAVQNLVQSKLITLEQDSDLYSFAKKNIPPEISPYIHFHLAPITFLKTHNWGTFLGYKINFQEKIDFAIIDGPVGFVIDNLNKI